MTRWIEQLRRAPWRRSAGWLSLLGSLVVVAGCAHGQGSSSFRVSIPTIVAPRTIACLVSGQPAECVLLLKHDHEEIVRQLKGACLALGQSREECHADVP